MSMKSAISILMVAAVVVSCSAPPQQTFRPPAENVIDLSQKNDDEEYELIVLDPGFDTWFQTNWNLAKDRSESYYSHWNNMYASAWNYQASRPHSSRFFDTMINYDPSIDYGIALERKLYYYFRWVDTKMGIPILSTPPPGAI